MRPPGETSRVVLAILDPAQGGVPSADYEYIQLKLKERGIHLEKTALYHTLGRLIDENQVERVTTDDGGAMYTRPSVLLRMPGLARVMPNTPARKVRRRKTTSDRVYENRKQKAFNRWADKDIQEHPWVHDHRPKHRCPVCGVVTPEIHLTLEKVADARAPGSESASPAKSGSRAGKRGT